MEEKSYFKDPVNPLSTKDVTKMSVRENLADSLDNLKWNLNRLASGKFLRDGGADQDDGHRPRSAVGFKTKWLMMLAALGVSTSAIIYLIETGVIDVSSPEADYMQQVVKELDHEKQSESDENKREP